jgi:hypothetical protein
LAWINSVVVQCTRCVTNDPWYVSFHRAGFAGVCAGILGSDPARQVHVQGQEALETVADWALLDWGLVARDAADELVPEGVGQVEADSCGSWDCVLNSVPNLVQLLS